VLEDKFRAARQKRGLSRTALARAANVPRSQLIILENGGNVTLSTLNKIAEGIGVRLEVLPKDVDLDDVLRVARDLQALSTAMHAAAGRIIEALGGAANPETAAPPQRPLPGGSGATRHEAGVDPERLEQFERMLDEEARREAEEEH